MEKSAFIELVTSSLEELPLEIKERMQNVDILVEDFPTGAQMRRMRLRNPYSLLGLYEGVPLTKRNTNYGMVLPDRITLFQKPLEAIVNSEQELVERVRRTVVHEIAHHFGIGDPELREMGY